MTSAITYTLKEENVLKGISRIVASIYKKGNRVNIVSQNEKLLSELDVILWTYEQLAFTPHVFEEDTVAANTPIVLSKVASSVNSPTIMLCLDLRAVPANDVCNLYEKIVFCISGQDEKQINDLKIFVEKMRESNINTLSYVQQTNGAWAAA